MRIDPKEFDAAAEEMEKKGFIEIQPNPNEPDNPTLVLTDKGRDHLAKLQEHQE